MKEVVPLSVGSCFRGLAAEGARAGCLRSGNVRISGYPVRKNDNFSKCQEKSVFWRPMSGKVRNLTQC